MSKKMINRIEELERKRGLDIMSNAEQHILLLRCVFGAEDETGRKAYQKLNDAIKEGRIIDKKQFLFFMKLLVNDEEKREALENVSLLDLLKALFSSQEDMG